MSYPFHVPLDHADLFLRGVDHEPVRGQPRSALGHGERLVDIAVQVPGELLFPPVGLGGQGLEPVPFGAQPAHLLVELLIGLRSGSSALIR